MPITAFGLGNMLFGLARPFIAEKNGTLTSDAQTLGQAIISGGNSVASIVAATSFNRRRCQTEAGSNRSVGMLPDDIRQRVALASPEISDEELIADVRQFIEMQSEDVDPEMIARAPDLVALFRQRPGKNGEAPERTPARQPEPEKPGGGAPNPGASGDPSPAVPPPVTAPGPSGDNPPAPVDPNQPRQLPNGLWDPEPPLSRPRGSGRCFQRGATSAGSRGVISGAYRVVVQTPAYMFLITGNLETSALIEGGIGGAEGCPLEDCASDWVQGFLVGTFKMSIKIEIGAEVRLPGGLQQKLASLEADAQIAYKTPDIEFQHWPTNGEANTIPARFKLN